MDGKIYIINDDEEEGRESNKIVEEEEGNKNEKGEEWVKHCAQCEKRMACFL